MRAARVEPMGGSMRDNNCPKCGSGEVIPDVRIIDHGHSNRPLDLSATVYTSPDAWIFKGPVSHLFKARVCGRCGYTEFYVDDPQGLAEAARRAASGT
jgi:predicted nucleic-acid-binding Zn-ribbon protein